MIGMAVRIDFSLFYQAAGEITRAGRRTTLVPRAPQAAVLISGATV
jgi:hypothetical protein